MVEKVEAYKSKFGGYFDTEEAAREYEWKRELTLLLGEFDRKRDYGFYPSSVAEFLVKNRDKVREILEC